MGLGICLFAIVWKMKSRIPKPTSGHLDGSFFLLKCPEVGLGICLFAIARMMKPRIPKRTSGHLERATARGPEKIFRSSYYMGGVTRGRERFFSGDLAEPQQITRSRHRIDLALRII